ncbi:hypothetical protein DL96DRAFT_397472 [Flagelloscypha sp. PMI_526]|nr:hypothetical protein DL96DRAFT_397472 [Flagelloscypha sp. PMI_526]
MSVKLSDDILTEIIHLVHDIDRPTIFSLNVINHAFHTLSVQFVYYECTFTMNENGFSQHAERIHDWLDANSTFTWVPACIRQISLLKTDFDKSTGRRIYKSYDPDSTTWAPIIELLPHLINLKRFIFSCSDCRFPSSLLHVLETHQPHVRLIVQDWSLGPNRGTRQIELNDDEELLARSPLLRELQKFNTTYPHDVSFQALTRLVSLAPNLEKLAIERVTGYPRRSGFCGNARRGESETRSRAAEILRLKPDDLAAMKLRMGPKDLRLWYAPQDFVQYCMSRFESVETFHSNFLFYKNIPTSILSLNSFDSLRHLNLWLKGTEEGEIAFSGATEILTARKFLLHLCPPHQLESLALRSESPISYLPLILQRHGSPTLRSLTLGYDVPRSIQSKPIVPSPFHPDIITNLVSDECSSSLTQLALSVSRVDEKQNDLLKSFRRFKHLQRLTLDFGSGLTYLKTSYQPNQDPYLFKHSPGLSLDEERLNKWEMEILNLQMPISTGEVEEMLKKIRESGCVMLGTLEVILRHPFGSKTEQKFLATRMSDETYWTTVEGYVLPAEGQGEIYKHDPTMSRLERLKQIWEIVSDPQLSWSGLSRPRAKFPDWFIQNLEKPSE